MKRVLHQPDLSLVSQIDWARLAAYIDGEGYIGIANQVHRPPFQGRGRYAYATIIVANTDPRLSEWLYKNFGGSVQQRKANPLFKGKPTNWKACFSWVLCNQRASLVLQHAMPYFIIKREQAELAIAFQATCIRCGVKGTPAHVLEHREVIKSKLRLLTARGQKTEATGT
jgi:hypothetical protein